MKKLRPHSLLFIIGFIYYLIIPLLIGISGYFSNMPAMDRWYADFHNIERLLLNYIYIVLSYLVAFYIGGFSFRMLPKTKVLKIKNMNSSKSYFVSIVILLVVFYLGFIKRSILFTGYETYGDSILGALGTINSVSTVLLIYLAINEQVSYIQYKILLFAVVISSLLLLGLGSRMYILIPILSLLIFKFYYAKNLYKIKKLLPLLLFAIFFLLLIGAWRIGMKLDLQFIGYLFIAEPIFTWWSVASFLANNEIEIVAMPLNYITSFLNFLPSFLFDNKANLIIQINETYYYSSPLGADSIFVNVQGNFGFFIGFFFMFIVGFYYSIIEIMGKNNAFLRAYYIGICSILPFQFFRDNFGLLNKQIFWNMLVIPFIIIYFIPLLKKIIKTR